VEVLSGSQPGSEQRRRKYDHQTPRYRALRWFFTAGDIALLPHSPLALAEILTGANGRFDLVAQSGVTQPSESSAPIPINSTRDQRRKRTLRSRANLLTQHQPSELPEICRQIQVDNALIKQAGAQRLYLTAGFLRWKTAEANGNEFRAPILFYPVTLVKKTNEHSGDAANDDDSNSANAPNTNTHTEASDTEYELHLDSNVPDINLALYQWCAEKDSIQLPEFESDLPLQDFFAQVAQTVRAKQDIELEFDVALGNSAPPSIESDHTVKAITLPDLPQNFDTTLAKAITDNKNLQQLHSVLNLLKDYSAINPTVSTLSTGGSDEISLLREYSTQLSEHGLSRVEFQQLSNLPELISGWINEVNRALQSDLIRTIIQDEMIGARHIIRLAGAIELIDKAPNLIENYKHGDLCFSATPALLQRARHQAALIEDELSALQETFDLDKVPAKKQLLSLIEELGGTFDQGPDIIDADYFSARRQFMEFSIEKPTNLTTEHRQLLGKLAKVLRFRELFVNNVEYRLALGPGYRGLRTNWAELTNALEYAQEISEVLESENIAAVVLQEWQSFKTTYINELELLQQAAESLRKLLAISGSEWQNVPAIELLGHAESLRTRLINWSKQFGDMKHAATKTPAMVLAQFSGKSQEDVLTEIHVGATQATIEQHISSGNTSTATVVETIEWLRAASQEATDQQLEINAIVEHLNIA
jgi:hypothetical protein